MVSAVFHSPLEAAAEARAAKQAVRPVTLAVVPQPVSAPAAREPYDWSALALKVFAPLAGIALLVGIWALLTMKGGQFPTPAATFEAALKLFADPFYRKGPNDQGI